MLKPRFVPLLTLAVVALLAAAVTMFLPTAPLEELIPLDSQCAFADPACTGDPIGCIECEDPGSSPQCCGHCSYESFGCYWYSPICGGGGLRYYDAVCGATRCWYQPQNGNSGACVLHCEYCSCNPE